MALTDEGLVPIPGMASRWVRLASGARAHYMTAGDHGPAVVLLHGGLPGSSGTAGWRFMAPYLGANGFRVYCPDQPGFGHADTSPEHQPDGVHSHVDFLQEFTTALCLDRFHLAGNSMGCMNTVNYVVAHPERVISYALIAGGIGDQLPPSTPRPEGGIAIPPYQGTRESMRELMTTIIHRGEAVTDDVIEMRYLAAERQREAHARYWPSLMQYGGRVPWEDPALAARMSTRGRLDRLGIPAVYLYGRQDVLNPVESGYQQEDVLPEVQFFYPDDCGHQGQTDRPDLFNPLFLEFFRDGKVTRQTADAAGISKRRPELAHLVEQV
ncbi:2-hydroxy-6-oxo-6-phenylhexa-2,4-dienoate hydrolase (plasmid) [Pseudonocardia sp. EC080610-09]|uniref:alpha/beta fold hydrolase n=1 Tax=unclassified Pseudonocardia TaxID=2619320 RepID=UPI0007066541|nr:MULTISPECIES: alpha/beta hydrolase [unclassified Pseudonocardia]ALL79310.1 2-hydroxy-6-oxo-6-phenylhexa-2,4-dienoate hydrolase [Pseudonocardia sp. EC080610-09]ALL85281.1 2-hydroxy-6-oxo-6-phenylhexa-2,4-dienoate hydrolase [Pseudonocardia sp. EC080619-01]